MRGYEELTGFENLNLEDSWVLGVDDAPDALRFDLEAVLTEQHPAWARPKPGEVHCYRRVELVFRQPEAVEWVERMTGPPAVDASGEADLGHIDSFLWDAAFFELEGDWGHVRIQSDAPIVVTKEEP